jgi:ABC-2 type transport system ATP-binding protein
MVANPLSIPSFAQGSEKMHILTTDAVTRRFGELTAVDHITISVESGDIFGLVGRNGAGKTTLIKMLTTLLPPTSGTAQISGFDIIHQAANVRRLIGYVPQMLSSDGALTGYENLLVFAKLYDVPRADRESRIREALRFMDLETSANKLVRTYSGGMIRRLEIAQGVLHRPPLMFLDEPTIGLDPMARRAVWERIRQLRADYGMTVFLTTHYMDEADELCDHVAVMHLGKLAAFGSPTELKASVGGGAATMDEVFEHYTGGIEESGGTFRETARGRRTARRLG